MADMIIAIPVNKLEVNNCIRRFRHSNVKINKRKNIVTDKIIFEIKQYNLSMNLLIGILMEVMLDEI